jgi:hypothetical protein
MKENKPILTKRLTLNNVLIEDIYVKSLRYFKEKEYHKGWRGYYYSLKIIQQDAPKYIDIEYRESGSSHNWGLSPSKDTNSNVEIELRQVGTNVEIQVDMYKKNTNQVYEFGYIDPAIFWVDFIRDYWGVLNVDLAIYQEYLYPIDLYERRLKWERDYIRNVKIIYGVSIFLGVLILIFCFL